MTCISFPPRQDNNPFLGNQSHVDNLIKLQAPARESPGGTTDRTSRRPQVLIITTIISMLLTFMYFIYY